MSELRAVPWPAKEPKGTAVLSGPLCLGLSSADADVDMPWAVRVDAAGRPLADETGCVLVADPSGQTKALKSLGVGWLTPDVKDPARKRILFQTKKVE